MAVSMIIEKIVEDPQSSSCPNISYADATGPIPSANPTGISIVLTLIKTSHSTDLLKSVICVLEPITNKSMT